MDNNRLRGHLRVLMCKITENQLYRIYGGDTTSIWMEKNEKAIEECSEKIIEMIQDEREHGKHVLENGGDRE